MGNQHDDDADATLLLTGATGFVGGELMASLGEDDGVRCLVRDASKLEEMPGFQKVEADLGDIESLRPALEGISQVFYLVHSMEPGVAEGFANKDREAAENFVAVASECSVERIIYLGGVVPDDAESEHLESRREVESILAQGAKEFIALRASMIVGAKSASFRTLVQLVDRMPVLAMPSWGEKCSQPVAIADVVQALMAARQAPPGIYDIAGPDVLSFEEMTEVVSAVLGQAHRSISMPFSNSRLEALAASVIVDTDEELLRPLMEGLHSDLVISESALESVFGVKPTPFAEAARVAIEAMPDEQVAA